MNGPLTSQIDLLSFPKGPRNWIPGFNRSHTAWRILSGKWERADQNNIIYRGQPSVKNPENISIIGDRSWKAFTLQVNFTILTNSIKPPEGGAIIYFLFKNTKNYYSLHFCLCKQRIEVIKRYKGIWTTLGQSDFHLRTQKDYFVSITTDSGIHQTKIDGANPITVTDLEIQKGCVGIGAKYCDLMLNEIVLNIPPERGC